MKCPDCGRETSVNTKEVCLGCGSKVLKWCIPSRPGIVVGWREPDPTDPTEPMVQRAPGVWRDWDGVRADPTDPEVVAHQAQTLAPSMLEELQVQMRRYIDQRAEQMLVDAMSMSEPVITMVPNRLRRTAHEILNSGQS